MFIPQSIYVLKQKRENIMYTRVTPILIYIEMGIRGASLHRHLCVFGRCKMRLAGEDVHFGFQTRPATKKGRETTEDS